MLTLNQVKDYLHVTYDEEDDYITFLIGVAQDYLVEGVSNFKANYNKEDESYTKLADMTMLTIIQDLYDNRYLQGQKLEMTYIIRSMLNQLEYKYV